ncbi:MAG: hypothetical protein ACI8TP_003565 [Acidimicrobiales bacterium]|jgi:hypothetical protein
MVISKGKAWGHPGVRPEHLPSAADDAEAARLVASGTQRLSLSGGDLLTTLGGGRPDAAEFHWFPMDLGWVTLDGERRLPFVANVVARGPMWRGEVAAVMNAAWHRQLYLGPRAHPNDGLLDVTVGTLPAQQFVLARSRAKTGVHVPHPQLVERRVALFEHHFDHAVSVWVDGVRHRNVRQLLATIESDRFEVGL